MNIRAVVYSMVGSTIAPSTATLSWVALSCVTLSYATLSWQSQSAFAQDTFAQDIVPMSQASTVIQQSTDSSQHQTTILNIDATKLRTPHILRVSVPAGTKLTGKILINGKVIKSLAQQGTAVNLSPYLFKGKNTIEILGHYTPAQSAPQVNFSGLGTQVSQQSGGNGILKQTLVINVSQ
jgi:hypothetical protein